MAAALSTTGKKLALSNEAETYFSGIREMELKNPTIIGFGISGRINKASQFRREAIKGSAFLKFVDTPEASENLPGFIKSIHIN
jgi:tryptophan synthase alpha chain